MRLALFTLEAYSNARAVRRFVADHAADIVFVGLSNPYRRAMGGSLGQIRRHLRRSGPAFLPYLTVNFTLVEASNALGGLAPRSRPPEAWPLATLCRSYAIEPRRIDDVNAPEIAQALRAARADLIVSFHFDQIFRSDTLAAAGEGGINVHPSLLPEHRGPTPTIYALAEDEPRFGVTVHRLSDTIDTGDILAQSAVTLPGGTTAVRAAARLHEEGRRLLDALIAGWPMEGCPQAEGGYCPFPNPALLTEMRRRGRKLVDASDVAEALLISLRAER